MCGGCEQLCEGTKYYTSRTTEPTEYALYLDVGGPPAASVGIAVGIAWPVGEYLAFGFRQFSSYCSVRCAVDIVRYCGVSLCAATISAAVRRLVIGD